MKKVLSAVFVIGILMFAPVQSDAMIFNGDFETGDFSGWTFFTTANGTLGPTPNPLVESFDTNNDSTATLSARFQVGQASSTSLQEGGGIFQSVLTGAGPFSIGADIASFDSTSGVNSSGGVFSLLIDGIVVDTHDFGSSIPNGTEFATLFGVKNVAAGNHEVRILMTRPFTTGGNGNTPYQYIDDVVLNAQQGGENGKDVIPEPASMSLLGSGLLGLFGYKNTKRKRKKKGVVV